MIPVTEDPAASVRSTARAAVRTSLGTLLRATGGAPYVPLVNVATDHDGAPLPQRAELADHTRNLAADLARLARSRLPTASQSAEASV